MSKHSTERLSQLIEQEKTNSNYLSNDTVEKNGENETKVYVKNMSKDDIISHQGVDTFSDSRGSGYVLSTPLENDKDTYKDLEDNKFDEYLDTFSSGDEDAKNNLLDDLALQRTNKVKITEDQKKRLLSSSMPLPDKILLLKMLNDKDPKKTIAANYKELQDKASSKASSKTSGLSKGLGQTIEKLAGHSQID